MKETFKHQVAMSLYLKCNKSEIKQKIKLLEENCLISQMDFSSWFYKQFQPEYSGWKFRLCSYKIEEDSVILYSESKTRCFKINTSNSERLTYQELEC